MCAAIFGISTSAIPSLVQAWTFDDLDRLVSAALAGGTTTYGYRANDELETITRASCVQTTYAYHLHGPIDTITTRDGSSALLHLSTTRSTRRSTWTRSPRRGARAPPRPSTTPTTGWTGSWRR
jgi:hypothetical protein